MASLWSRVGTMLRPSRKNDLDTLAIWNLVYGGGRDTWSGQTIGVQEALQVATALCCGRVIAEGVATMPWKVHQAKGRVTTVVYDHQVHRLLTGRPNEVQTAYEFVEMLVLHLVFCGNAYVWKPTVGAASPRIDQLWLLQPQWVTPKVSFPKPAMYEVQVPNEAGGLRVTLTAEQVWHLRGPSWVGYLGLEPIKLARQALGLMRSVEEGQARLQQSGYKGPGYLSVEGSLTGDQHKQLTKWLQDSAGARNADVPLILDRAAKWLSTAQSNVEAQMIEQRKFQIEEVCRFMRVSPIMVGHTQPGSSTYGTVEQLFLAHAVHTLGPWLRRLEDSANTHLLTPVDLSNGCYTKFNEKSLQRMTAAAQIDYLTKAVGYGIMTRNEAREVIDLNPLDGLDDPLTPVNTVAGDPPTAATQAGAASTIGGD